MKKQYLLGIDAGSSSVKASLLDVDTGQVAGAASAPATEMPMHAERPGWAEQDPDMWWEYLCQAVRAAKEQARAKAEEVAAIGISYQMHGLVAVDAADRPVRPSIIWCDSRAVETGRLAQEALGADFCLSHYLNSPGNFTASKLAWVKQHEPEVFSRIRRFMLPGDYLALRLTGEAFTTISGLSEGILWDFAGRTPASALMAHYGLPAELLAPLAPTFGHQGALRPEVAELLGLAAGTPVTYRAGDQPNNAFSLNVLHPGDLAATAGTSGVVYAVHDQPAYDPQSRVNTFAHVNYTPEQGRYGVLLCINGTGILNSWLRKTTGGPSYEQMNEMAATAPIGSDGLAFLPFGNGAERVLGDRECFGSLHGLNFNRHTNAHLYRAAQEGIVFAMRYGLEVMQQMGLHPQRVRAGHANMFLSPLFRQTFVNATQTVLSLYNTDGAQGAARGAGLGSGVFASAEEAFAGLTTLSLTEPDAGQAQTEQAYQHWKSVLEKQSGF